MATGQGRRPGRPAKYKWDLLTNGEQWVLYQGKDFQSELASFRALVWSTAARKGLGVVTSIDKHQKSVTFTFKEQS